LVENVRVGVRVKPNTLLSLGKHFNIDAAQWHLLTASIDQIIPGDKQQEWLPLSGTQPALDSDLEMAAQRYSILSIKQKFALL
jgi:hypothetical protein